MTTSTFGSLRRTQRASGRLWAYRTVDLVVLSVLAVAIGVVFWGWDNVFTVAGPLFNGFPPSSGLVAGVWTMGAGIGALLVRRPGAALLGELVAALVENLLGNQWGFTVFYSALFYGIGVEVVLALLLWRRFTPVPVAIGLALGSAVEGLYEIHAYYSDYSSSWQLVQVLAEVVSGLVVGGLLSWLVVRALAGAGALQAFPAGREAVVRGDHEGVTGS